MKIFNYQKAKKTIFLHVRITKEVNDLLYEISDKLGFDKSALARMLLLNSLKKLKKDALKFGWDNLEFTIKRD